VAIDKVSLELGIELPSLIET
jgi:hypothetical protein